MKQFGEIVYQFAEAVNISVVTGACVGFVVGSIFVRCIETFEFVTTHTLL